MAAINKVYLRKALKSEQNENVKSYKIETAFLDLEKCKVCLDKATGVHYGIPSCEGCKVYFYFW